MPVARQACKAEMISIQAGISMMEMELQEAAIAMEATGLSEQTASCPMGKRASQEAEVRTIRSWRG